MSPAVLQLFTVSSFCNIILMTITEILKHLNFLLTPPPPYLIW